MPCLFAVAGLPAEVFEVSEQAVLVTFAYTVVSNIDAPRLKITGHDRICANRNTFSKCDARQNNRICANNCKAFQGNR